MSPTAHLGMEKASDIAAPALFAVLGLVFLVVLIWSVKRVEEDADRRGWPGLYIAAAVFLTWPWGWLVYKIVARRSGAPSHVEARH